MLGCHSNEVVRCLSPSGRTNHLFVYCCDCIVAMVTQTLLSGNHVTNNLIEVNSNILLEILLKLLLYENKRSAENRSGSFH